MIFTDLRDLRAQGVRKHKNSQTRGTKLLICHHCSALEKENEVYTDCTGTVQEQFSDLKHFLSVKISVQAG